ncbi:MAG TPA: DUF3048 domain-containing protein [Candidatus Baltobacteraceae bacterium]|nr:DUF3048 domain-containing protein [Candidatus Baltobacteraceae bacterium]
MRRWAHKDHTHVAGLIFGLLFFPTVQLASRAFLQEGIFTFWIARSLGIERIVLDAQATSTPIVAPAPDRTRPLAVMIDNHPDARPQSGVSAADVVWEVPVEGGLTRNMLIFRSASASEIGPVRSARPYFLRWAREFDAIYAHVGGSDEALSDLASGALGLDDANEFRFGSSFRRDGRRSAPHNTYTSTKALRELAEKRGWEATTDAVDATLRGDLLAEGSPAAKARVTYIRNGEEVEFRWDASLLGYALWRDGRLARDRDGTPIVPKTVIVLETDLVPIADPHGKGLIGLEAIGSGGATVLRDGKAVRGTWKKTSASEPTRVEGQDGAMIPFAPGQLWYAVVAKNRGGGVEILP